MKFNVTLPVGMQVKNVLGGKNEELGNKFTAPSIAELNNAIAMDHNQHVVTPAIERLERGETVTIGKLTIEPVSETPEVTAVPVDDIPETSAPLQGEDRVQAFARCFNLAFPEAQ